MPAISKAGVFGWAVAVVFGVCLPVITFRVMIPVGGAAEPTYVPWPDVARIEFAPPQRAVER